VTAIEMNEDDDDGPGQDNQLELGKQSSSNEPEKVEDALKHLGNVKRKKMSPHILKDVLGDDGDFAVKGIKAGHVKLLRRDKRKFIKIHDAVDHFEGKMKKRRVDLSERTIDSVNKTYTRHNCDWKQDWNSING